MWRVGFEPTKALSHMILSHAPLTTREPPHKFDKINRYKNLYKYTILGIIEDDHNNLETPVPIPNTEVKQVMLLVLVFERK